MTSYKYKKASVSLKGLGTQPAVTYLVEDAACESPEMALADLQRKCFAALDSR